MSRDEPDTTLRDHASGGHTPPASLLVIGEGSVRAVVLTSGVVTIGRAPECEVRVAHGKLSRRHAILRLGPPLTVQDLGSTNGTRVGGEVHHGGEPIVLADEGSFQIGPFAFVLVERARLAPSEQAERDALRVDDPALEPAPAFLRDFASSAVNVLILGETGAGKEVLAQRLHALSGRPGPFVAINCATLSEALLESELFGHEQGAFTGASRAKPGLLESAREGTLFLDEIGELPAALQPKLLRAIETREVLRVGGVRAVAIDVRFIAATHRELAAEVAQGRFRSDLFYRIDGISLRLSPLRACPERIVPLALRFLSAARADSGDARPPEVSPAFLERLVGHPWPGNVRELKAVCERAVVLARGATIDVKHLILAGTQSVVEPAATSTSPIDLTPEQARDRARIMAALEANAGNQSRAAAELGISRATLATRLVLYRIPRPRDR
ncbi:sigma 54-interacting transcriptional regulator [Nannocystaceae bacterium ST9]